MKKYFLTEKYFLHFLRVSRKSEKRRKKTVRKTKAINRRCHGKKKEEVEIIRGYRENIKAPENCSLLNNSEEVIKFISKIEEAFQKFRSTFVILREVKNFDYGALTLLLSTMSSFKIKGLKFNGNQPKEINARVLINDSGFFESLYKNRNGAEYSLGSPNQIITHMDKNVIPQVVLPIMEESSKTIWGDKKIISGLHSALMELMQNTNNHASFGVLGEKHWWLSINHDKQNRRVSFSFVDHGVGIVRSLKGKPKESPWYNIASALKIRNDCDFIQKLMEGALHKAASKTTTKKSYRGKGLPNIKRMVDYKYISNLHIITNNVHGNVESGEYNLLSNEFKGTFFYWEIGDSNKNKPWNIQYQ